MAHGRGKSTAREAVGVFDSGESLEAAVDALLSSGFNRAELSLLARDRAVEEKLGHLYEKVAEAEDDPKAPRKAYVSREALGDAEGGLIGALVYIGAVTAAGTAVATGGGLPAAAIMAGLAGGAGGLIGSVFASMVGHNHAEYIEQQLQRGGLLLWVRTPDSEHESRAKEILSKHSAHDVHIHDLPTETQERLAG